jgi:UDP-N-acetylmuramoyl-tripeptide--D-alanyl-D-alanine ligase
MKKILLSFLNTAAVGCARMTLRRFRPLVIAVTGSAGKTSAKEAIYAVLKEGRRVRRTQANLNNEFGVPLTILGDYDGIRGNAAIFWAKVLARGYANLLRSPSSYPEVLVLEYGADRAGDIANLLRIARPDIGVLSAIGSLPVHVENYPTGVEGVVKEKGRLIYDLSASKEAVMNGDDPHCASIAAKSRATVATYGFESGNDIRIGYFSHVVENGRIAGISFKLQLGGSQVPVTIRSVFSISHAYAAACGVTVGMHFGMNLIEASEAFVRNYAPVAGRSTLIEGIKHTQIIDESYNASPLAMETALRTLQSIAHMRRIAVLGDMLELGAYAIQAHQEAGRLAASSVDILLTVGPRSKFIASAAIQAGMRKDSVESFDTAAEAGLRLQQIMREGDVILVKGSHSIGLEGVVEEVKKV